MAKFFRHYWNNIDSPPDVPMGPLRGGQLAKQSRAEAVFNGLDTVPALGRRVIYSHGTHGSEEFAGETIVPSATINRIVGRTRAKLSPGYVLSASCLYVPSGSVSGGVDFGQIQIDITWIAGNGNSQTTTTFMDLEDGDDLPSNSSFFNAIRSKRIARIQPQSLIGIQSMREWSQHGTVEITVSYNGNPRVVDFVISEVPQSFAAEADDDPDLLVSGMYSVQDPEGASPSPDFPLQRLSETTPDGDFRGGMWQIMDQVHAQQCRLNPFIFHWTGHVEESDSATAADDSFLEVTAASTLWTRVPDGITNSDPLVLAANGQPGWSMASAAYARPYNENHPVPMANNGAVPVRVAALVGGGEVDDQDFEIRFYTTPWSYITLSGTAPIETSDPIWVEKVGWLECGKGPGDPRACKVVANRQLPNDDDLRIYALTCEVAKKPQSFKLPQDGLLFHIDARNEDSFPGSGTTVTDLINGNTGTLSNMASTVPDFEFNGSNSLLDFGNDDRLENLFDGGGTVVQIFKADTNGEAGFGRLVTTREFTPDTNGWATSINATQVALYQNFSTTAGRWDANITLGDWYCAIFTYNNDDVANNPTLYLNRVDTALTETDTPVGTRNTDDTNDLSIGNHPTTDRTWDGDINVVMLYNREITEEEAQQIFDYYDRTYSF